MNCNGVDAAKTLPASRDSIPQGTGGDLLYRIAAARWERRDAFRLVYEAYLRSGLARENRHRMWVTPYHLLPTTQTFVALLRNASVAGKVISTVSLVGDGQLGLPIESVFPEEVALRRELARERGMRIAEVTSLADRRTHFRRFLPVFCELNRHMAQHARLHGIDQLLVAVHPRHARFYVRYLGFQACSEVRAYPSVRNHPAVALCLDFAHIDQFPPDCYDRFFGEQIDPAHLKPCEMSDSDRKFFARAVTSQCTSLPLGTGEFSDSPDPEQVSAARAPQVLRSA